MFERPSVREARRKKWEEWAERNLRPYAPPQAEDTSAPPPGDTRPESRDTRSEPEATPAPARDTRSEPGDSRGPAGDERHPAKVARLDSPLVGRDQQLAQLHDAFWQVTTEHTSLLFTVLGEAGTGKTRLVKEFWRQLPDGVQVLEGSSPSSIRGLSFWPLSEMLLELTGLTGRESEADAERRLAGFLDGVENGGVIVRRLAPLAGYEKPLGRVEESFWAVRRFLEALTRRGPLVMIFDDAQWASPILLDLITALANWLSGRPILLLVLSRPELLDSKVPFVAPNLRHLLLAPLEREDCVELIRASLGGNTLDPRTESDIVGSADGNPLFVVQSLHLMIDRGVLLPDGRAWRQVGGISVPRNIEALFAARLRELPPDQLAVLGCGGIAGQAFYLEGVQELLPGEGASVCDACASLEGRGFIYQLDLAEIPDATAFRFRHDLVRKIALERFDDAERGALHLRYARWLEGRSARRGSQEACVGHHLGEAAERLGPADPAARGLGVEAAQLLLSAARRIRRTDREEARTLLSKASDLVPATAPLLVDIQLERGRVLFEQRKLTRSELALENAVRLAEGHGETTQARFASLLLRRVQIERGNENAASSALAEAVDVLRGARAEGDLPLAVHALRTRASAHLALGRFGDAKSSLDEALALIADRDDLGALFRSVRRERVSLTRWGPEPVTESINYASGLLDTADGDKGLQRELLAQLAVLTAMQGDHAAAEDYLDRAEAVLGELRGRQYDPWFAGFIAAPVHLLPDHLGNAEREFRQSCRQFERNGQNGYLASRLAALADVLSLRKKLAEAEECARRSDKEATAEQHPAQAAWRCALAQVRLEQGEYTEARALVDEARRHVHLTDDIDDRGYVLFRSAQVYAASGNRDRAVRDAEASLEQFVAKGNQVQERRVREFLTGLPSR
jgi:tetratricopeptide (TPR) repeat protein